MLAEERLRTILEVLEVRKAVSVAQLCQQTGASEATIRRDLNELSRQGKINKVHGGAMLPEGERIARYAAKQVCDDDFVFIDAGTTTLKMVDFLNGSKATFVTTGIECARRLAEKGLRVYVPGGLLKPSTQALVGASALESMSRYNFTKAFVGTNGISVRQGFTTPDTEEASVKSLAIERSYQSFILADSSKFGKVAAVTIASLDKACILTDMLPDKLYSRYTVIKEVDSFDLYSDI